MACSTCHVILESENYEALGGPSEEEHDMCVVGRRLQACQGSAQAGPCLGTHEYVSRGICHVSANERRWPQVPIELSDQGDSRARWHEIHSSGGTGALIGTRTSSSLYRCPHDRKKRMKDAGSLYEQDSRSRRSRLAADSGRGARQRRWRGAGRAGGGRRVSRWCRLGERLRRRFRRQYRRAGRRAIA